ncbi:MAG TPA: TonB-dependent receptor plug domain-containing protein, partial [Opitutaceae bacterium]|nr:TonB-dependent receptor plug domain-containing protein [Opitutaceae bacterium]
MMIRPRLRRFGDASAALLLAAALMPSSLLAQQAGTPPTASANPPAAPAASAPAPGASAASGTQPANPDLVQLSPFVVDSSAQKGYLSTSTLAGTRLNTNIGDLAGSITVVTKQQLEDTNSLDINDVFRYESNTEGALTYTPIQFTRGQVADALGGSGSTSGSFTGAAATGNRVRGLAAVDNEEDNFFALSRIPFNSYNTQSIEIDRGPNSIIYGSGSPAGIVNQSRTQAVLDKFSGSISASTGSFGTLRETFDINVPLIPGHLALYAAQMYDSQGYEQKPSSDITRRQYAALTFEPFKSHKTRIIASFENYNEYANDPNYVTPIDDVTPWLAAGRPVWNTITDQVTYLNTGQTSVAYALGTTYPNYVAGGPTQANLTTVTSPYFVPGMTFFSSGHSLEFIDQGTMQYAYKGGQTGFSVTGWVPATLTASQALVNEERMTQSTTLPLQLLPSGVAKYGVWEIPTIASKDIYDWSSININSIDHTTSSGKTYYVDLQQSLFDDPTRWGSLNLDVAWFRQELKQTIDAPLSQASATTMFVDTSEYLFNGQANPHLGSPFLDVYASDVYVTPEINNNWRGMLEYELSLQDKTPAWLQWTGHHRFVVAFSQHDDIQTNLRYRPGISGGDANYLPTATALNATTGYGYSDNNTAVDQIFYLNGATNTPNGHASSSAGFLSRPSFGGPTNVPINTYNYSTGAWQTSNINVTSDLFPTGGLTENLQDSKTYFWQSYFWNDRIVGVLGLDDDQVK